MPFFDFEADSINGFDFAKAFMEFFDFDCMQWGVQFGGLVRGVTNGTLKDGVLSSRNLNDWVFTFLRLLGEGVGVGFVGEIGHVSSTYSDF